MNLLWVAALAVGSPAHRDFGAADRFMSQVGQPADVAPSAYRYRADRRPDANPPESWLALLHYAHLPLNRPFDRTAPAIRRVLTSLLWEEIRPVQTLELSWPAGAHRPPADKVVVTALMNQGASSSWWNNLGALPLVIEPKISGDGKTYSYPIGLNTCGLVVSVDRGAKHFDVPQVRAFEPSRWKAMNVEVEWGFDSTTAGKDFGGHVTTYDGRISDLAALDGDSQTATTGEAAWTSQGRTSARRGIRLSVLYIGTSKWRKQQPYTTQADDVARTIVTVWTKSGNFSFLAADLENGPILAPEYGFFVRRTSPLAKDSASTPTLAAMPLATRMDAVAGSREIRAWGSEETPWFGSNPTDHPVSTRGITLPAKSVAMHPGEFVDVVAEWRSPIAGRVRLSGGVTHAQSGGNGIEWWIVRETSADRQVLAHGATDGTGSQAVPAMETPVQPGERVSLVVGPKGDHRGDTTILDWTIAEINGAGQTWNLAKDVAADPQAGNPHADGYGNPDIWRFCSETPTLGADSVPSDPPIKLASNAATAKEFVAELKARDLRTIRERIRAHPEQTWDGAVTATRGANLPPIPAPPPGAEPRMQVNVPSERLNAQWNLGAWHLVRHFGPNPQTGKLWFNDFPYGILAAETYLVLAALDDMGSHQAAEDGFSQWLSLPMAREHPVGQFSDGNGALTFAEGPTGYGGQMDGVHAFGPGSIGWALSRHYALTGDKEWLKASAPRMLANAEWMLRQRKLLSEILPGGERLWGKGLQPALQVTPDSGGLWMQFYECEGYYWASVSRLADALAAVDPARAARLKVEAEHYRRDLRAAVERSIVLSPVVPVRDGAFHSVIPFACYCRGLATGAWGWQRDGSGTHVGPLYWDTVQTAAALVSPAGLLPANDVRVQGYLDVLEDRLLLENANVGNRDWFQAGWQYQGGLERTSNMHLAADDIPVFIRSFLNCYAVDILPNDGYVFNEHAVHGPPDKIFEEAAFLERFRNLLVMEDGPDLWLARGTPRAWLESGQRISVQHAPTEFGEVGYEIVSDVANGYIRATISMPSRIPARNVRLRLRHPSSARLTGVRVNGKPWRDFDSDSETVRLHGLTGTVTVDARYAPG